MSWKNRLFNNMFLRNMLADLGWRSSDKDTKDYPLYFTYKLGQWKTGDYYLYFTQVPYLTRYKNEIFNKMKEFSGSGIGEYLEFHYRLYEDKTAFLAFLKYEIFERLQLRLSRSQKIRMKTVSEWVNDKLQENKPNQYVPGPDMLALIQKLSSDQNKQNHSQAAQTLEYIKSYLAKKVEALAVAEQKLQEVASSIPTGNIELTNQSHEDRWIQLLLHLSTITPAGKAGGSEQLFKNFSQSDITSILKNHFTAFKDKKYNTVQKTVTTVNRQINWKDPKLKKLNEALTEYFYT